MRDETGFRRLLAVSAALLAGVALYAAARQTPETVRFDFGSMDRDFLARPESVHARLRMNGPIRHEDGSVEVIDFYGRLTAKEARFRLPYHALRSPLHLRVRCHRFGLEGTVTLSVNGTLLEEFVFTDRSYPWGGIRAIVPEGVAEKGPLEIALSVEGGAVPPSHLPADFGLGIDWIEVEPLSRGVRLIPSAKELFFAAWSPLLLFWLLRRTGGSFRNALLGMLAAAAVIALSTRIAPVASGMALSRLWVAFPLGYALLRFLPWERLRPGLSETEPFFLARLWTGAVLVHSMLIFFPNHAPPDLWNHMPQVEWLSSLELHFDEVYRFSSSSDPFDDGHVRPHFGVEYGAPYPPWFYLLTLGASWIHGDVRFLVEFLSVVLSAAMMVPLYLIARAVWDDRVVATIAVLLFVFEISVWHHAHRVHAPGNLGELVFLVWLAFLVNRGLPRSTGRGFAILAGLTTAAALSYAATLVHVSIFSALAILCLWAGGAEERLAAKRLLGAVSAGLLGAFLLYYAPYAIQAVEKSTLILERETYDPPASFLFLRNQMRDTVRILWNGYPLYVALALIGFWRLPRSGASSYHRRLLVAAGLSYLLMLVLKDPAFLPMVFLHAKEDLFFAPFACLLGALALFELWRGGGVAKRGAVILFLSLAAALQLRDQVANHDTLRDQVVQGTGE